ncbi:hypothetical protein F2Q70_00028768 [Brassica cretica]|uniref:Transmembrane protein n=1 Tax=Brassica cretica TaxID=69181 RepID=A0A8S9L999_BRACR|nr:hypothetical protein F2Q70_00028768 [Brassica cretica]
MRGMKSLTIWALFAALLSQQLFASVTSIRVPRSLAASLKPLPLPLSPSLSLSQIFSLNFSVSEASSCWDVEKMTTEHESSQLYAIQTVLFLSGFGSLCFFST